MCKQCVECSSFFEVITSPFQANLSIIHCRWKLQNLSESPIKKIRRSRETIWSLFNYDNQLNEIITKLEKHKNHGQDVADLFSCDEKVKVHLPLECVVTIFTHTLLHDSIYIYIYIYIW